MKYLLATLMVLLLVANVALLLKQHRIESAVMAVQTENARLAQELADRPAISAAEFQRAQARLQQAQSFMDAVEDRLTNATAILNTLKGASNPIASARAPRVWTVKGASQGSTSIQSAPVGLEETETPLASAPALQPSSSHGPDGKVRSRSWGPEQVLGPPNTQQAGDVPTAWAPYSSQGTGEEWLHVNYDQPVDISEINVRETHNPGAISKIAAVMPDGREVTIWEGVEPTSQPPVNMTFSAPSGLQAQSVKVYLDRTRVPGWNEIDAVELVGRDGTRQWATSATSSSSYAEMYDGARLGLR